MDRHRGLAERISRKKKIFVKIDDKVRIKAGILKGRRGTVSKISKKGTLRLRNYGKKFYGSLRATIIMEI